MATVSDSNLLIEIPVSVAAAMPNAVPVISPLITTCPSSLYHAKRFLRTLLKNHLCAKTEVSILCSEEEATRLGTLKIQAVQGCIGVGPAHSPYLGAHSPDPSVCDGKWTPLTKGWVWTLKMLSINKCSPVLVETLALRGRSFLCGLKWKAKGKDMQCVSCQALSSWVNSCCGLQTPTILPPLLWACHSSRENLKRVDSVPSF